MELFETYVQNKSDATFRIFSYFCGTKNRRDGGRGCGRGGGLLFISFNYFSAMQKMCGQNMMEGLLFSLFSYSCNSERWVSNQ